MLLGLHKNLTFNSGKIYPYATGGDYVYLYEEDGKTYRVHEFLSTGTSTLNVEVGGQMEYLVVGGGGGGGRGFGAGGGGAGGVLSGFKKVSQGEHSITVGVGGNGAIWSPSTAATNGGNSSFDDLTAIGGGAGGSDRLNTSGVTDNNGSTGGSGGGGRYLGIGGSGILGQGFAGGTGRDGGFNSSRDGGGGGGASEVGETPATNKGGDGGDGVEWPIGSGRYFGGGGGGSVTNSTATQGAGGLGGGGNAPVYTDGADNAESGDPNTGGGGGGSFNSYLSLAGSGGSGIVIVRYVIAEKKLWTPSELSSLKAWYDAADESTVTVTSSRVSQLNDKSGNSLNLTKGTTGPTYTTNGLNGLPVMTFGGTEWLNAATASDWKFLHDGTQTTVTSVVKFGTSSNPEKIFCFLGTLGNSTSNIGYDIGYDDRTFADSTRNNGTVQFVSSGGLRVAAYIGNDANNTILSDFNNKITPNQNIIATYLADPSNGTASNRIKFSSNGGVPIGNSIYTTAPSNSNPTYTLSLGSGGNGTSALEGTISEAIILDEFVDLETRQKLEGYLAHKWGLTNNLPAGHPYKYEPPYKVEPEEIVTDGLVLNLDAGDYASYPRSGTTWYDISGNGNNGTLTNGPTYDSANKGSIVFDGTNDYVDMGDVLDISSNFSLSVWFKGETTQPDIFVGIVSKDASGNFGNYGFYGDITSAYVRFGFYDTGGTQREVSNSSYSDITANTWVNYIGTYDGSQLQLYRNGVGISSASVNTTPATNNNSLAIGGRTINNYYFNGKISNVQIYNRALSATEISQNFNALRGRYGI